jgi:DNA-binding transcriptional ArsR family regulator
VATLDADLTPERAAALHDGLAHPARVVILRLLRARRSLPLSELRREVAASLGRELDTRTLQHHVWKMQVAGLVDVERRGAADVASLLVDVALRVRPPRAP